MWVHTNFLQTNILNKPITNGVENYEVLISVKNPYEFLLVSILISYQHMPVIADFVSKPYSLPSIYVGTIPTVASLCTLQISKDWCSSETT